MKNPILIDSQIVARGCTRFNSLPFISPQYFQTQFKGFHNRTNTGISKAIFADSANLINQSREQILKRVNMKKSTSANNLFKRSQRNNSEFEDKENEQDNGSTKTRFSINEIKLAYRTRTNSSIQQPTNYCLQCSNNIQEKKIYNAHLEKIKNELLERKRRINYRNEIIGEFNKKCHNRIPSNVSTSSTYASSRRTNRKECIPLTIKSSSKALLRPITSRNRHYQRKIKDEVDSNSSYELVTAREFQPVAQSTGNNNVIVQEKVN